MAREAFPGMADESYDALLTSWSGFPGYDRQRTLFSVSCGLPNVVSDSATGKLSRRPLVRTDAADMLKRRLKQAGLPAHHSPHSFRATGITNFLENDGTLEAAQRIAGHADSRTTKLYDRRGQKVLVENLERIRY
jgi:integrase